MLDPAISTEIVRTIFAEDLPGPAELEHRYPPRTVPEGAMVTRVGPSPTGFVHIGTLYVGLLSLQFARQSGGVCFLRIEDTDKKREVEGAVKFITRAFDYFGVRFNEGGTVDGAERGSYGPYTQSCRMAIYHSYVRHLLLKSQAYPCFCTPEELDEIRKDQQARGVRPGYHGEWAVWRDRPMQDVVDALRAGTQYVIRFRSSGDSNRKIVVKDLLFGERMVPENDQDIVIMKSDGLPTYHLAHVVDDHLMRTTHVIRGDEWFTSLPIHLQMFEALGWPAPTYAHIAPINKIDGNSRRKLSKRKDPEATVGYFNDLGYPPEAVIEYLLNLANSDFEDWRKKHPAENYRHFALSFERLRNSNGPLFDFAKLDSISRDVIARFSPTELYDRILTWFRDYDRVFCTLFTAEPEYAQKILAIDRDSGKVRKDIIKWSDVRANIDFFFDSQFCLVLRDAFVLLDNIDIEEIRAIVLAFKASYRHDDNRDEWFEKIKVIARERGFAEKAGDYKRNPDAFKGTVTDVAKVFRVLLTGKLQTPDLYSVMQTMGQDRVFARLDVAG